MKTMTDDIVRITSKLDTVYTRALRAKTDSVFFKSIYDYIETFDSEPSLVRVNKTILEIAQKEILPLNILEEKTLSEISKAYELVDAYVQKEHIQNNQILHHLKQVKSVSTGETIASNGKTKSMYGDLTYTLMLIVEYEDPKHLSFCKKFGEITEERRILNWNKLSPTYREWEEKSQIHQRLSETSLETAWNEIAGFHNWYRDFETVQEQLYKERKFWELQYASEKFRVIQAAITGTKLDNPSDIEVLRSDYERYLDIVHSFIKESLSIDHYTNTHNSIICNYDGKTGLFTINKKNIEFDPSSIRGSILDKFLKSKTSRTKSLYWEDLYDIFGGIDTGAITPEQKRHKVYYAIDGINSRIATEYLIEDFFEYHSGNVALNPKFHL